MLLKSEIPWHIVAIVFIAFASWIWNKVQEVAADRKRRRFQQVKRSYEKQERQPQSARPQPTVSAPSAPPPPAVQQKSALQQMMDAMSGNVEEIRRQQELAEAQRRSRQQQQPQQRSQAPAPAPAPIRKTADNPPPLPNKPKRAAASAGNPRPLRTAVAAIPAKKQMRRKKRQSRVRSLLRGKDSLRHALIASEILQKPKGLDE